MAIPCMTKEQIEAMMSKPESDPKEYDTEDVDLDPPAKPASDTPKRLVESLRQPQCAGEIALGNLLIAAADRIESLERECAELREDIRLRDGSRTALQSRINALEQALHDIFNSTRAALKQSDE